MAGRAGQQVSASKRSGRLEMTSIKDPPSHGAGKPRLPLRPRRGRRSGLAVSNALSSSIPGVRKGRLPCRSDGRANRVSPSPDPVDRQSDPLDQFGDPVDQTSRKRGLKPGSSQHNAAEKWRKDKGFEAPAGFARVRIHDLKHTFGRRLRAAGVGEETRKVLLGHKNGDITTHYSAAELAELIAAVNRIDASRETPAITVLRSARSSDSSSDLARRLRTGRTASESCKVLQERLGAGPSQP